MPTQPANDVSRQPSYESGPINQDPPKQPADDSDPQPADT